MAMAAAAAHVMPPGLSPHAVIALVTAILMQGGHALALVMTGLWLFHCRGLLAQRFAFATACAFALGVPLFCGSIFLIELADIHPPLTAPLGGLLLIVGWIALAASALTSEGEP